MADLPLDVRDEVTGVSVVRRRFRASVTTPSWTMRVSREVLRRDLTAFLAPQGGAEPPRYLP